MLSERLWKTITISVVKKANNIVPPRGPSTDDVVNPVPVERRWPGLLGTPLIMAEQIPRSERPSAAQNFALKTVLGIKEILGLAACYPEPYHNTGSPYYKAYEKLCPPAALPEDFGADKDRLAGVAFRGPFSILTRRAGNGFLLDLGHMEAMETRKGLLRSGGRAHFAVDGGKLKTIYVEQDGNCHEPGRAGWDLVEKRFLVGLNGHMTFVEHLLNCHMVVGNSYVVATLEALPSRHALRSLLQPFIIETLRVNNDNIDGLIKSEHSNVPSYTGYPLSVLDNVTKMMALGFDFRMMDPEWRAREQGTLESGFPTEQSRIDIFRLFRAMTARYFHEVLREIDPATRAWCQLLDAYIPNGVARLANITDWNALTLDHAAHIAAVCMFTSSVGHHIVADTTRDYMMQFDIMPPAVTEEGMPTRGMVLEKMNSITIAGILRYRLLDGVAPKRYAWSDVIPEGRAREIWDEFQLSLQQYKGKVEATDPALQRYLIRPENIPSSIHA